MAGVGDEVGPHAVDAPGFALVLEHHDEEPGAAADRRDRHPVDALDRHALDIIDHLGGGGSRQHALDRRLHLRRAELHQQRQARRDGAEGDRAASLTWTAVPAASKMMSGSLTAAARLCADRPSSLPPSARRGAVGLALASRAAGCEQGGDEEKQDGAGGDRRRNAGGKADRKHGSRAGGEHPAILRQPPRCKAQEPARLFFPSGVGHRLPIA